MTTDLAEALAEGPITVHGRIVNASNHTLLVEIDDHGTGVLAVYKPGAGERPLWDFPFGKLHLREVAAYEVSAHLGWEVVPPTILRDGPLGEGSVQAFIDHDPRRHYFTLLEHDDHDEALARMAAFDVVVNNADRKGGHVLLDADNHIWGCDHGLTFHEEPKLRTVIWEFGATALTEAQCADLARLISDLTDEASGLRRRLSPLLDPGELDMLRRRAEALSRAGALPDVAEDERPYPWPPI